MDDLLKNFEQELKKAIKGEVRFDTLSKKIYGVDASIYEIEPIGVVLPRDESDVQNAIEIAKKYQVQVIPRGAGTGIAGGCIGRGLVIDLSKHMNLIHEISLNEGWAICDPGVVQDQLNAELSPYGFRLGPDTSTGNRATLGGMVGNNSSGARSLRYGKMGDHVLELWGFLSTGEKVHFRSMTNEEIGISSGSVPISTEARLTREIVDRCSRLRDEIDRRYPKIPRRVSGYNLDEFTGNSPYNLCKLICGSEGGLLFVTKIKLKIIPAPVATALCVIHFNSLQEAFEQVPKLLQFPLLSLEMVDEEIIKMGKISRTMKGKLDWLQGDPGALIIAEVDAQNEGDAIDKLAAIESMPIGYHKVTMADESSMQYVWDLRKAGLGLLLSRRSYSRAIGFLEDVSVSPYELAPFMKKFMAMLERYGKKAGIYGHIGAGCMHVRPFTNLREPEELKTMRAMMLETADLLLQHQGSLTGEHGDGIVRSWMNEKMFGEVIYKEFQEIKKLFDPDLRLNPGKVIANQDLTENLRIDPNTKQRNLETQFDFSKEGGFALSADLCNGNGQCRKLSDVMCPSYQASYDERHTTRARAQGFRAFFNAKMDASELTGKGLYDVLDLCIECKGCKKECPSQVDMAKMKSEFLYHYQKKHGKTFRSRLFANVGLVNRIGSIFAPLANWIGSSVLSKMVLDLIGIAPQRNLPEFASTRFSKWIYWNEEIKKKNLAENPQIKNQPPKTRVVLFNDTYTEFNVPNVGHAAYRFLTKLGFEVIVPQWSCCGRPMISKGFLPEAKNAAKKVVDLLHPFAKEGLPIIFLEPSCYSAIIDDYLDLLPGEEVKEVAKMAITFDRFVEKNMPEFKALEGYAKVHVHGHCHQKSLDGMDSTLNLLRSIPGLEVNLIQSGCCGMAGSFGYEREHYDFSVAIAHTRLIPQVKKSGELDFLVANGMSCRTQVKDLTGREPLHLAELLDRITEIRSLSGVTAKM